MIKYEIKNRFTGDVQFVAEIDCSNNTQASIKRRLAVLWALENKADLREADLSGVDLRVTGLRGANLRECDFSGANLRGCDFSGADLRGCDFSGADLRLTGLRGANLRGCDCSGAIIREINFKQINTKKTPVIKRIHQRVANVVQGGNKLDMSGWRPDCGTKHCRAGWVVVLAGAAGEELEERLGTSAAAALIYAASDPNLEKVPDFHCPDDEALADILECAEREKNLEAAR